MSAAGNVNRSGPTPAKGQTHTFVTSKGNIVALVTASQTSTATWMDKSTCLARMVTGVAYTVDGAKSTGSFKGATGSGPLTVHGQLTG